MRTSYKIVLILALILVELAWVTRSRISLHGEVLDEPYRHSERFATLVAKSQHPSPDAEAAFNKEVDLLHAHMQRRGLAQFALFLVLNGAGIYYFWHRGARKTTA
jgi:hypothetical protein